METITGTITDIRGPYKNRWAVLTVRGVKRGATVTGALPLNVNVGDYCQFEGGWSLHPTYGDQFCADKISVSIPKDKQGQALYLQRVLKGVGPATASAMLDHCGDINGVIEYLEGGPSTVQVIPTVNIAQAHTICNSWQSARDQRRFDQFCAENHISPNLAERLVEAYQTPDKVIRAVKDNPYDLADDVWGIGFRKADVIAGFIGIPKTARRRITAGIFYALQEASRAGHCYLTGPELAEATAKLLSLNAGMIEKEIDALLRRDRVAWEKDPGRYYLQELFQAEKFIAGKMKDLLP